MIRVQAWNEFVSPKFYGPLAIWPWLKISPQSSLNIIYLIITAWQWLVSFPHTPCIPVQIKPIKACQGKSSGHSPLERVAVPSFFLLRTRQSMWICLISATMPRTLLASDQVSWRLSMFVRFLPCTFTEISSPIYSCFKRKWLHRAHIFIRGRELFYLFKNGLST